MVYRAINKGEKSLHYKLEKWNKSGTFDIMNNISKHITLVQLMHSLGNMNHTVSVVWKWIFDSNDIKYLPLSI